jgi:hypothetical protein
MIPSQKHPGIERDTERAANNGENSPANEPVPAAGKGVDSEEHRIPRETKGGCVLDAEPTRRLKKEAPTLSCASNRSETLRSSL